MSSLPGTLPLGIYKVLQDETRLGIIICLQIYQELTIKEISDYLHKGKTTIAHHLGKLEEGGVITWSQKKDDPKKYKTKYYSIIDDNLKLGIKKTHDIFKEQLSKKEKLELINSICRMMRTEASILTNLMNWFIHFTEEKGVEINLDKLNTFSNSFVKTLFITDETYPIYQEYEKKMTETIENFNVDVYNDITGSNITHISTNIFIPVKELLDWRKKLKRIGK